MGLVLGTPIDTKIYRYIKFPIQLGVDQCTHRPSASMNSQLWSKHYRYLLKKNPHVDPQSALAQFKPVLFKGQLCFHKVHPVWGASTRPALWEGRWLWCQVPVASIWGLACRCDRHTHTLMWVSKSVYFRQIVELSSSQSPTLLWENSHQRTMPYLPPCSAWRFASK